MINVDTKVNQNYLNANSQYPQLKQQARLYHLL